MPSEQLQQKALRAQVQQNERAKDISRRFNAARPFLIGAIILWLITILGPFIFGFGVALVAFFNR